MIHHSTCDTALVPNEVLNQTKDDLLDRFDGLTAAPQTVLGIWKHEGQRYEDELGRFVVDVDDTEENQFFFANLKATLLERFQQIEIYMVSFPIERI